MSAYDFPYGAKAAVIGSTGGIGSAILDQLASSENLQDIYAFSRSGHDHSEYDDGRIIPEKLDFEDENSIKNAAKIIDGKLDFVFIATGVLHGQGLEPEKAIKDLDPDQLSKSYAVNAIGPALIGKHFLPLMRDDRRAVFAALSARVGSISDNNDVGGWCAYRASKAGLNMILKNFSIEMGRKNKHLIITGLQPGTVDTRLSEPFQKFVKDDHLFAPEFAAKSLLKVLNDLSPDQSGRLFDWQGEKFAP